MSTLLRVAPLLFALAFQAPPPEPGWTSLFNGKDLTGWKVVNPASWSVKDGAIVANGTAGHAYYDGEFRNHMFRNFELKVDVKAQAHSNGGVYVLTEYQETGFPKKGFEIQVNNTYTRDPVKTGSLYHVQDVTEAEPKDDEWFTEHIIVKGNNITVKVNDKQVVDWTQPAGWNGGSEGAGRVISGPGTIALQAHDPNSTVAYKNIRIKPLD
jgi:3-keto-disaccharide hydrolase